MPIDLRDLLAALLRLRGALLEFGIAFVVAQMLVTLAAALPLARLGLPDALRCWLVPPYARQSLGLAPVASVSLAVATQIGGLPALLVTGALGLPYLLARAIGALLAWGVLTWVLPRLGSQAREPMSLSGASSEAEAPRAPVGLGDGLIALLSDLLSAFLVSAILGGLVLAFVPREVLLALVGPSRIWGPALAAWLALPFRATAGTELPLASALLVGGMGPGSAAALVVGAAVLHYESLRVAPDGPGRMRWLAPAVVWAIATVLGIGVDLVLSRD